MKNTQVLCLSDWTGAFSLRKSDNLPGCNGGTVGRFRGHDGVPRGHGTREVLVKTTVAGFSWTQRVPRGHCVRGVQCVFPSSVALTGIFVGVE